MPDKTMNCMKSSTDDQAVGSAGDYLCDESWLHVFRYLSFADIVRLETVCRRWRRLIGFSCSHKLSLRSNHQLPQNLAERLPRLRHINLGHYEYAEDNEILKILKSLRSLQSLNISHTKISGECFTQVPQSLTEVYAIGCHDLAGRNICVLAERCPNLETIDISNCDQLNAHAQLIAAAVGENCPKLKRFMFMNVDLFMENLEWTDANEFRHLVSNLVSNLPLLEVLKLDCQTNETDDDVIEDVFYHLGRSCPRLRCIDFGFINMTDASIIHLSPCQQLEHINFSCSERITDRGLLQLGSAHPRLTKAVLINCRSITSEGVANLCSSCPGILNLDVTLCRGVSITETQWTLPRSLQSLNVSYTEISGECFTQAPQSLTVVYAHGCSNLTDRNVCMLSERCPNLETIVISCCGQLTGQFIPALAKNCRKLKRLAMGTTIDRHASWIVPETEHLMELSNLSLLEVLDVNAPYNRAMTDAVVYKLGRSCPRLRSINFKGCVQVTDASIFHLSPCQQLERIDLTFCTRITDKGLLQLGSAHPRLKKVFLEGCRGITSEGMGNFCSLYPEATIKLNT